MSLPRPPRALSFDLDDTLWSCDDVIQRAERTLYQWLEHNFPLITARHGIEDMRDIRQEMAARSPEFAADLTRLRAESLRRHAEEAGYSGDMVQHGVEIFLAERHRVVLYPDVLPVLESLRSRFSLIALTNGNACVHRVGIGEYFDVALSAADVGAAKPDPAMFRSACAELSLRPGDLMHVGDDPLRDVHAARGVGARSVWVNRSGMAWPEGLRRAQHEMQDLYSLPRILAQGCRGATVDRAR